MTRIRQRRIRDRLEDPRHACCQSPPACGGVLRSRDGLNASRSGREPRASRRRDHRGAAVGCRHSESRPVARGRRG